MDKVSLSFNYATRRYECWERVGDAVIISFPEDEEKQLELDLPPPIPPKPGEKEPGSLPQEDE